MKKLLMVAAAALCVPAPLAAQHVHAHSPYAGMAIDSLATIPLDQADQLREGEGMGLALVGELNQYPGPRHAIDLASELGLSQEQLAKLETIRVAMTEKAVAKGAEILDAEQALTRLFRSRTASGDAVEQLTVRIGRATGELRAIHLRAHLETRAILTADQIAAYDRLRGYGQ